MPFRPPAPQSAGWTSKHWTDWLVSLGVIHSVRGAEPRTCWLCNGPTRSDVLGNPYPSCYPCGHVFRSYLRQIVPISFSISPNGLTSLIAQAKNEDARSWLRYPLASLLHQFLQVHWTCLTAAAGGPIDMITPIPSHAATRSGTDHLARLHSSLSGWPVPWTIGTLTKLQPSAADSRRRTVDPSLFALSGGSDVAGRRILLIDDLCTTGGTIASAAATLVNAGAERPVAVTIGRQVRFSDLATDHPLNALLSRGWERDTCAAHVTPSPFARPPPWER